MPNSGRTGNYIAHLNLFTILAITIAALTACGQPTPAKIAKQMVSAASSNAGDPLANLNNTPAEQMAAAITEWNEALKGPMTEDLGAMNLIEILVKTGELFPNGKFSPAESMKFAARARALSPGMLASWQTAVGRFEPGIDKLNTVWFMLRQPAMFDGSKLNPSAAGRLLARVQALPSAAVESWASATEVQNGAAVFHLIQIDALFTGTTFQTAAFDSALPAAKELIQEKRSKRKGGGA
jgi:hypothetical protein